MDYPNQPQPTREDQLSARAAKVGYALYPPTGDRWLLVDTAAGGWSTHASLEEVKERLADGEDGNDGDDPDLIGPDDPAPRSATRAIARRSGHARP